MFLNINITEQINGVISNLLTSGVDLGQRILAAIIIFAVGKFIVNWLNKLFAKFLERRNVEASIQTFLKSMINILLLLMLGSAVVSKLGIEITGFAALLASAGVAIGMLFLAIFKISLAALSSLFSVPTK